MTASPAAATSTARTQSRRSRTASPSMRPFRGRGCVCTEGAQPVHTSVKRTAVHPVASVPTSPSARQPHCVPVWRRLGEQRPEPSLLQIPSGVARTETATHT